MSSLIPRAPFATKDITQTASHEVQASTVSGVIRHVDTAESMVTAATDDYKRGILRTLFPNKVDRAKAEAELRMVKTEFEVLHKALVLVRTASIQTLEESINSVLLKGKAQVRGDALAFVTEQVLVFIRRLNATADELADQISERQRRAESGNYTSDAKEMILVQCHEQVVLFKQLGDEALVQMKGLLDEQIKVGAL